MSRFILNKVGSTPGTPAVNKATLFYDTDKRLKSIHDDGRVEYISPISDPWNYLINGGFQFAQRQAPGTFTTYSNLTGRAYGADRWGMTNENASIQYQRVDTIAAPETGLAARFYGKFKKTTSAGKIAVSQVLEGSDVAALRGRTVRFQAKMRYTVASSMTVRMAVLQLNSSGTVDTIPATFISAFNTGGADPTLGTNLVALAPTAPDGGTVSGNGMTCVLASTWTRFSACFAIPSNCVNLIVVIYSNAQLAANDELNIGEAGLFDGQAIQEWLPRSVETELALCERFYCKTFAIDTAPATTVGTNTGEHKWPAATAGAITNKSPEWRFPRRMRATPATVTLYNPAANNAQVRDEAGAVDTTVSGAVGTTDTQAGLTCIGNAATAAGNLLGAHISADAEL